MNYKPTMSENSTIENRLTTASDVIDALGGSQAVATLLGVGASAVSNYRRQGFPASKHYALAEICKREGLNVAKAVFGSRENPAETKPTYTPAPHAPPAPIPADAGLQNFIEASFEPLSLPILQPAAPFIDRMGVEMQRRLYSFTDPGGAQLCLRPDLTIPTALQYLADNRQGEVRYCYQGTAFRYQPRGAGKPEEFTQLGVEIIGGSHQAENDVEILRQILLALKAAGIKASDCQLIVSNAQFYINRVDGYDLSEPMKQLLKKRLIRNEGIKDIQAALKRNAHNPMPTNFSLPIKTANIAGRTGDEIGERIEQRIENATIAQSDLEELNRFALEWMKDAESARHDKNPSSGETNLAETAIAAGVPAECIFRRLSPAQKMAYYTGIFFEITVPALGDARPVATGGRYDDLLQSLGAERPIPAVGGAIALERRQEAAR